MSKSYGIKRKNSDIEFYLSEIELEVGDLVVIKNSRGLNLAKVYIVEDRDDCDKENQVLRKANKEDYDQYIDNLKNADNAYKKAVDLVKEFKLDMSIVGVYYNLDKTQLVFNFVSDTRVDFRELAKKLASIYHTRIELRQIGARDKAKEIGGIGICGSVLCCQRFMKKMNAISMTMAKNQNLALNPSKINGVCGRLLCCLAHENDEYVKSVVGLPAVGDKYMTDKGEGVVLDVDILKRKVKVLINGEKEVYDVKGCEK